MRRGFFWACDRQESDCLNKSAHIPDRWRMIGEREDQGCHNYSVSYLWLSKKPWRHISLHFSLDDLRASAAVLRTRGGQSSGSSGGHCESLNPVFSSINRDVLGLVTCYQIGFSRIPLNSVVVSLNIDDVHEFSQSDHRSNSEKRAASPQFSSECWWIIYPRWRAV